MARNKNLPWAAASTRGAAHGLQGPILPGPGCRSSEAAAGAPATGALREEAVAVSAPIPLAPAQMSPLGTVATTDSKLQATWKNIFEKCNVTLRNS